jgi:2-succinyl-6-hydroxy-2,4-cyclohexadiene-1-carboxylate synthase
MALIAAGDNHYYVATAGDGQPLLLLHGFTGSSATWLAHEAALAPHCRMVAPDLLGHGRSDSPPDPARYRMERCVSDLVAILDAMGLARVNLLGYSMGGRVALAFAIAHPKRVRALVLESASPGLALAAEREARRTSDNALADFIESRGIQAFVERWEAQPLFASQSALPTAIRRRLREQRLANNPLGLANSLRGLGTGVQPSLWEQLPGLAPRTRLICGALDSKFVAIGQQMANAIAGAEQIVVPDAGHAVNLERPAVYERLVLEFLSGSR